MENSKKIIILLILTVVMVGGMFWGIQFGKNAGNTTNDQVSSGTTSFNGTIRVYDPILLITSEISDALLTKLRNDERVKAITEYPSGRILNITTREDVFPLAEMLRTNGVKTQGVANIVLPGSISVRFGNGTVINVSTQSIGSVKAITEPLVDADNEVPVSMMAIVVGNGLVDYGSPTINSSIVTIHGNATVISMQGREYVFMIPWEKRSELDIALLQEKYGNESIDFSKNDLVTFPNKLTVPQITEKRKLLYITYISDTSASVTWNFTNKEAMTSDFGNVTVAFPDSVLKIVTNDTVSLPYNGSSLFSYSVLVPPQINGFSLKSAEIPLKVEKELSINQSVEITINGLAIGNTVVSINGIGPG